VISPISSISPIVVHIPPCKRQKVWGGIPRAIGLIRLMELTKRGIGSYG